MDTYIFNVIGYISIRKQRKLGMLACSSSMISQSGIVLAINIGMLLELSSFGRTELCQSIVEMTTEG